MKHAPDGHVYFIDHVHRTTTWIDPRTRQLPPHDGHAYVMYAHDVMTYREGPVALPEGWEVQYTQSNIPYFIDHKNQRSTWQDPRICKILYERDFASKRQFLRTQCPLNPGMFQMTVRRTNLFEDSFFLVSKVTNILDVWSYCLVPYV